MLEAAKAVFVEHGYAGATLDDVIEQAGGSRATLYKQFGGKEGLFAAVIAEIAAEMVAPLAEGRGGPVAGRWRCLPLANRIWPA